MSQITEAQKYTAFGLLGSLGAALFSVNYIDKNDVMPAVIMFGIGSAVSTGHNRLADLLKNGRSENNEFGSGTIAELTLFGSIVSINALPHMFKIFTGDKFNMSSSKVMIIGAVFATLGFMQNKNSLKFWNPARGKLGCVEDQNERYQAYPPAGGARN